MIRKNHSDIDKVDIYYDPVERDWKYGPIQMELAPSWQWCSQGGSALKIPAPLLRSLLDSSVSHKFPLSPEAGVQGLILLLKIKEANVTDTAAIDTHAKYNLLNGDISTIKMLNVYVNAWRKYQLTLSIGNRPKSRCPSSVLCHGPHLSMSDKEHREKDVCGFV